jgi:hypothetical protein
MADKDDFATLCKRLYSCRLRPLRTKNSYSAYSSLRIRRGASDN